MTLLKYAGFGLAVILLASSCGTSSFTTTQQAGASDSSVLLIEPDFNDGALSAAEDLRSSLSGRVENLPDAEEWFVTIELDKRVAPGLTRRPLRLNTLVNGFLKDVAEQAVTAEFHFNIGDDPVSYTVNLESDPDVVLADLLAGHLEVMQERAEELGTNDPPPENFRLVSLVVPVSSLEDLRGPKNALVESGDALSLNVGPGRQPQLSPARLDQLNQSAPVAPEDDGATRPSIDVPTTTIPEDS